MKYMLTDKIFYPAAALLALLLIAFSITWPQGLGTRSPAPFGHPVVMPDYFRMIHDQQERKIRQEADKVARQKAQADAKATEAVVADTAAAKLAGKAGILKAGSGKAGAAAAVATPALRP